MCYLLWAVASPGGCMWVHLHPIHTPVHPPFRLDIVLINQVTHRLSDTFTTLPQPVTCMLVLICSLEMLCFCKHSLALCIHLSSHLCLLAPMQLNNYLETPLLMGLSYVPETPNIMGLSYVERPLFNMGLSYVQLLK
jgi:hypothetical protein